MSPQQWLHDILAQHDLAIDDYRVTTGLPDAGHFRILHIGTGQPRERLDALCRELKQHGCSAAVTAVTNPGHPDYLKPYLEVQSFWWEPENQEDNP